MKFYIERTDWEEHELNESGKAPIEGAESEMLINEYGSTWFGWFIEVKDLNHLIELILTAGHPFVVFPYHYSQNEVIKTPVIEVYDGYRE